jgi:hypothetical protein
MLVAAIAPAAAIAGPCDEGPATPAAVNGVTIDTMEWSPFRRPEVGWAIYAPRIAAEIGATCPPASPGFAAALTIWQARNRLPTSGVVDVPTFAAMNTKWTLARPFVMQTRGGQCPEPPEPALLATATPAESYGGKTIQLRADALSAWRRMTAAARANVPGLKQDRNWLTIFSGFRAPVDDDLRCATDGNCQGVVRATCSSHRTGLGIDAYVGHADGLRPDSSDDANRRAMVATPVYRWLVANAARFGFINYVFEPWHWEYSPPGGQTPAAAPAPTKPSPARVTLRLPVDERGAARQ